MSTPVRLLGFLAALAAVFGLALVVGRAAGPVGSAPTAHDSGHDSGHDAGAAGDGHDDDAGDGEHGGSDAAGAGEVPGGLMVSRDGYALALAETRTSPGTDRPVRLRIIGPDGSPVTDYEVEHEKRLHLIAVRRDLTGFQHVHPTLDRRSGVWSVDLDLTPGAWRVFADFRATGATALTLGADLLVSGEHRPAGPGQQTRRVEVDGYQVALEGELSPGADARLTLRVSKDGEPVTDLEPYLGAYGHLVALRAGDLAYLHVHPDGDPDDRTTPSGPEVVFHTAVPSGGTYHLYFDFQHDGVVRTAGFTVSAGDADTSAEPGDDHEDSSGHEH